MNFHRNQIQGTHGDYVAHSERTGRAYVLSRAEGEWLLTVHHSIACPGGVLTFDPSIEVDDSVASETKGWAVSWARKLDAKAPASAPRIGRVA